MVKIEMISEKVLEGLNLSQKEIDEIKAKVEWKILTGKIEISISVQTTEDLEKRLKQIAGQIISQNKDVYKTRWEKDE